MIVLSVLEKKLKTENFSDSEKQILCDQVEQLAVKLDKNYADWIGVKKREDCAQEFEDLSKSMSHYRNLINQYGNSKYCRNQTSLLSSTSAGDKELIETLIDTGNGAIKNAEENLEVYSRHSATHGSKKQPSITFGDR